MGGKDWKMNVFENEKKAQEYVENTYGFIVEQLKRLSMFESIAAELKITPFMVHRWGERDIQSA